MALSWTRLSKLAVLRVSYVFATSRAGAGVNLQASSLRCQISDWGLGRSQKTYMKFFHTDFLTAWWLAPKVQHPKREGLVGVDCLYDLVLEAMQYKVQHILWSESVRPGPIQGGRFFSFSA